MSNQAVKVLRTRDVRASPSLMITKVRGRFTDVRGRLIRRAGFE